jgi:hypothetical protein
LDTKFLKIIDGKRRQGAVRHEIYTVLGIQNLLRASEETMMITVCPRNKNGYDKDTEKGIRIKF